LLVLLACSDDDASNEGNGGGSSGSAGSAGSSSNAGGSAGSSAGGDNSGGSSGSSAGSSNVGGTANDGGSAGSTGNGTVNCAAVCDRSLNCSKDEEAECLDSCETAVELCPTEAAAAQTCGLPRPDSDFHCEDGQTTINDGVCETEYLNLGLCIFGLGGL
jgi:hypothetical protein